MLCADRGKHRDTEGTEREGQGCCARTGETQRHRGHGESRAGGVVRGRGKHRGTESTEREGQGKTCTAQSQVRITKYSSFEKTSSFKKNSGSIKNSDREP
jgi:hypothetical protein